MAEAKPQAEPSMEEILASIRRIISEDEAPPAPQVAKTVTPPPVAEAPPPAAAPAKPPPAPAPVAAAPPVEEEDDEVLDLTERVAGDSDTVVNLEGARRPGPQMVTAPKAEPEEIELRDTSQAPPPREAPRMVEEAPRERAPGGDLVSAAAAAATTASFAALARAVDGSTASDPVSVGGRTLEDIVKEIMRPMIREWLDANLPALTEKLVRREIERIAHKGQD